LRRGHLCGALRIDGAPLYAGVRADLPGFCSSGQHCAASDSVQRDACFAPHACAFAGTPAGAGAPFWLLACALACQWGNRIARRSRATRRHST
jgi:hypothetical protein